MKKLFCFLLSFVLLLGCFAGCAATTNTDGGDRTITDSLGRQVAIPQTVDSIVCVGVGALRYSCYMGAADLVVGVEDYEVNACILSRP